jgi:hypothetical protein
MVGALAAVSLTLSGCGTGTPPGVAAQVGAEQITDQEVDDFAQVLCAIDGVQGTASGTPTRTARFLALQILLAHEVVADMTDLDAVDEQAVEGLVTQLEASRSQVPSELRDTFDEAIEDLARTQEALVALGQQSLQESSEAATPGGIPDQAAFAEGDRLRAERAEELDIEVDPRFGVLVDGTLQPSDGSLSVPVSDLAKKGSANALQADESVVSMLPATQKCS